MLERGDNAPDFELKDTDENSVKLSDFRGQKVILYFYPRDNTPGCTKEACNIRDNFEIFKKNNIKVFGVSMDDQTSHKKFSEKYNLPFQLLCDTDAKVSKKYGVYGKKNMFGMQYFGIYRTTFVIDEEGKIMYVFKKVDVENHTEEIFDVIENP